MVDIQWPVGNCFHIPQADCPVYISQGLSALEQVIQRVTQNPATRFGLKDRGTLEVGKFADIVVFNDETISDQATFEDPAVYPVGINYVLVNGDVAVDHERCTGVLAGRAIP